MILEFSNGDCDRVQVRNSIENGEIVELIDVVELIAVEQLCLLREEGARTRFFVDVQCEGKVQLIQPEKRLKRAIDRFVILEFLCDFADALFDILHEAHVERARFFQEKFREVPRINLRLQFIEGHQFFR